MNLLFSFLLTFQTCLSLPELTDIRSLSKTLNYLLLTSKNGIGIYDLSSDELIYFKRIESVNLAVLSPSLDIVYFIKNGKQLYSLNISAEEPTLLRELNNPPKVLGVGQKSLLLGWDDKSQILDFAGFELPESEREKGYNYSVSERPERIYLPPIFDNVGEKVPINCALADSSTGIIFAGTRGKGVFIYDLRKFNYVDSIITGVPDAGRIVQILSISDTFYILSPNELIRLTPELRSFILKPPTLRPDEKLTGILNMDTLVFVVSNKGDIFEVLDGGLAFYKSLKLEIEKVVGNSCNTLYLKTPDSFLIVDLSGDTFFSMSSLMNQDADRILPFKKGFLILKENRLFLLTDNGLYLYHGDTTLNRVLDVGIKGDTIWILEFENLKKIYGDSVVTYLLPFQGPERLLVDENGRIYVQKTPFLAHLSADGEFIIKSIPQEVKGKIKEMATISRWILLMTQGDIFLCKSSQ